ncbi:MAG: hypothetical protein KDD29_07685 [Flavobacteriales bacterium]|nr:hypothetical protein [Flavobacteriales bacterium]MCB9335125.1 hypothetical protein [Flavobacteriales bacterium]
MKYSIFIVFFFSLFLSMKAQQTVFEEARTIYKRENTFGGMIHTRGWGLDYRYGVYTSGFSRRVYEIEFATLKHPKEIKSFSSILDNSNGYFYGKKNYILSIRPTIGSCNTFISKQSVRGVAISYLLSLGFDLAYAKPVYLEIITKDDDNFPITEVQRYDPDRHNRGDIIGKASFFRGFFNGRFFPGAFAKAALNFESSRQASNINALEVGATFSAFLEDLPIMAYNDNQQFILNFYVALSFGTKKTE